MMENIDKGLTVPKCVLIVQLNLNASKNFSSSLEARAEILSLAFGEI